VTAPSRPLAQQLLDAEVEHHLDQLSGVHLEDTVRDVATRVLAAAEGQRIVDAVDQEALTGIVTRALLTVPGSTAVREIVDLVGDVLHEGPADPHPLGELVPRDRVEALLDEVLALHPLVERVLDRLAEGPLVGTMATRFMGRVVGEVVQANKAVAGKVPGLGSLVSLGTSAASKAMGAADKQVEALLGGTVGKGGTYAVRRLNRIVVDTMRDPTTREALLEVWDLVAAEPVRGLDAYLTREELDGVMVAGHDLATSAAGTDHAARMGEVIVAAFLDRFGDRTPVQLLDELELDRDQVVDDLVQLAPGVVGALRESGDLEALLRSRLEPFWASDRVTAILDERS
jgi:hypothetical protein